ncbi:unnamed protein product [Linum tenue]|uniref:F-box domain-containing protein n=1 Tax=Linum tenue TaxID=586396 RepID=A0AAV0M0Y2_9ROSI|nr:unnamed protein product [Linum tenue]
MSRKRKRGHREEAEKAKETDRMSHLSEDILLHILSSLDDTKTAVQTCSLLSKRWRYMWKDVRALNLDQNSFTSRERYTTFVRNFLSSRSDRAPIDKLSFTSNPSQNWRSSSGFDHRWVDHIHKSLEMFMDHAGRTGPDHYRPLRVLANMVASIVCHKHHESLELTGFTDVIQEGGGGGFRTLKALSLACCRDVDLGVVSRCLPNLTSLVLSHDELIFHDDDDDPFSIIPRLEFLKINQCRASTRSTTLPSFSFKVSGPQLLELEIRCWDEEKPVFGGVLAPKLESLCFGARVSWLKPRELSLPSLDHASVYLQYCPTTHGDLGYWRHEVLELLRGLRNAESLDLCLEDTSVYLPHDSPLNEWKQRIRDEVSQFTRLKTSSIRYPHESADPTSTKGE